MIRKAVIIALLTVTAPGLADAKIMLQCVRQSQHPCVGECRPPAWMGSSDCKQCEPGPECQPAKTWFSPERFLVVIDGDKGKVSGDEYTVKTPEHSYGLTPVSPGKGGRCAVARARRACDQSAHRGLPLVPAPLEGAGPRPGVATPLALRRGRSDAGG
jgi:hypothetical protein